MGLGQVVEIDGVEYRLVVSPGDVGGALKQGQGFGGLTEALLEEAGIDQGVAEAPRVDGLEGPGGLEGAGEEVGGKIVPLVLLRHVA